MNSSPKRTLFFLLLSVIIFALWGNAVYYGQYIREHYQSVGIRIKGTGISKPALEQAVEKEKQEGNQKLERVSAWNRLEDQNLESEELYSKSVVQLIEVYGDMNQVYPLVLISGSIPDAADYTGCLIDQHTAYELFGTVHAVGNLLTYQGRRYRVRGIIRSSEPVCLLEIYDDGKVYSNLELCFTDKENSGQLSGDFMRQYGLADSYTEIDGCLYARLLELLYLFPAWLLGFCLLYVLLAALWKRRMLPCQALALILLLAILWPLLSWLTEFELYIPQQFIPTKWSDFSFWSRKFASLREWMRDISNMVPYHKDILLRQYAERCISCTAAAMLGILAFITWERILFSDGKKAGGTILIALAECLAVYILLKAGRIFTPPRGYLGMPVFYMIARDVFCWWRDYITEPGSRVEGKHLP